MSSSRDDLVQVAFRHAAAEGANDLAGTMATLEGEPVYELYPIGRNLVGMDRARRYYEHFFAEVSPRIQSYRMIAEWTSDEGVLQEYSLTYKPDGGAPRNFRIMGLLKFGQSLLSGERIWASDELLRIMFAPVWDELEPAEI